MASVNRVTLIGNLGRDPEVRYTSGGMTVCSVSLATTSSWKDKATGERRDETEWHRVVFYNRLAEIAGEYLKKGRAVFVEGRLKTRKWQDKQTGADRYSTEIVADQMQMLGGRDDGEQPARHHEDRKNPGPPIDGGYASASQPSAREGTNTKAPVGVASDLDDDIPF